MPSKMKVLAGLERLDKILAVKQILQRTTPVGSLSPHTNPTVPDQNFADVLDDISFVNFDGIIAEPQPNVTKNVPQ